MPTRYRYGDRVEIDTTHGWLSGYVVFVKIHDTGFYLIAYLDNGLQAICTSISRIRFLNEQK